MKAIITILIALPLLACSAGQSTSQSYLPMIGATAIGAAVGAGTGAIVGNVISNGDVTNSALLGAAIGGPVLAAGRYIYIRREQDIEIVEGNEKIQANYVELRDNQVYLDQYRDSVLYGIIDIEPSDETNQRYYEGPTIGYQ